MQTIYKYEIYAPGVTRLQVPASFVPLHVAMQDGVPCLWAHSSVSDELRERTIRTYATGEFGEQMHAQQYIGTIFDGEFVWHVFDQGESA